MKPRNTKGRPNKGRVAASVRPEWRATAPVVPARKGAAGKRREAILAAALAVFSEHGFEAARLDDIAVRAGVAKGTLYVHFEHKEALFGELIRALVAPVRQAIEGIATDNSWPARAALSAAVKVLQREVLETDRRLLLRLVISEGPRFPAITMLYHREVVAPGLALFRTMAERARAEGGGSGEAMVQFPHLIVAPLLLAVIWDGLFSAIEPLDVDGLLDTHLKAITASPDSSEAHS